MALNSAALATLIVNKFTAKFGEIQPVGLPAMQLMAEALAEAMVEHIQSNAEVLIKAATDPSPSEGLQRDSVTLADTLAPTVQKSLTVV